MTGPGAVKTAYVLLREGREREAVIWWLRFLAPRGRRATLEVRKDLLTLSARHLIVAAGIEANPSRTDPKFMTLKHARRRCILADTVWTELAWDGTFLLRTCTSQWCRDPTIAVSPPTLRRRETQDAGT